MSGSKKLTDEEKNEMLADGKYTFRGVIFQKARTRTQQGDLDDYINFLSQNLGLVELHPTKQITDNFKL